MSGRTKGEIAAERWRSVWRLKRQGYSERAIGRILKVGRSTVAHYVAKGPPPAPPRMILTRAPRLSAYRARPIEGQGGPLSARPVADDEPPARQARGNRRSPPGIATVSELDARASRGSPKKRRRPGIATVTDIGTKREGA